MIYTFLDTHVMKHVMLLAIQRFNTLYEDHQVAQIQLQMNWFILFIGLIQSLNKLRTKILLFIRFYVIEWCRRLNLVKSHVICNCI